MSDSMISFGLYLTYAMLVIALLGAVIFPVVYMLKDFKSAKSTFAGIGAMLVVFVISYAFAGNEVLPSYAAYGTTESSSKLVSTGLVAFYLLSIGAIAILVYSEITSMFKK